MINSKMFITKAGELINSRTEIPNDLINDNNLLTETKFVFITMATYSKDYGKAFKADLEDIAETTGYTLRDVEQHIQMLIKNDWLTKEINE